jgi:hypothetical protein
MATTMLHFLPQAPHQLWQTAASPFILPQSWQSMYQKCPRCGGSAPNVCDEVWPDNWWEDDMLGLMYQGHIPPSKRISPWEDYYAKWRVEYTPAPVPQTPLRIETNYQYPPHEAHVAPKVPITPPQTPGVMTAMPFYVLPRPATPTSPSLPYSKQATFNTISSFDSAHSTPSQIIDLGMFLYNMVH